MENRRLSDGSGGHDTAFYVALDEKFQRVSAVEALKIKARFPKAIFYCPKCYKIDPNNKTRVNPSNHKPPRFNRYKSESHLRSCQYKNAVQYLKAISQKIQVRIDGKEIQLSLMPYEGRGIVNEVLGVRLKNCTRADNRKFMELVREILTDYEMENFQRKYKSYKVGFEDGKSQSFKNLFTSIDNAKANFKPYEEKLNIVVGQVKEVIRNDDFVLLNMDSSRSPYELYLYFDRFFYPLDSLLQLESKRIASMGYIQKQRDGLYVMEIVSTPHQVAILDDEHIHLSPKVQEKEISSFVEQLTEKFHPIKAEDFYRSYFQHKLEQLQISNNRKIDTLKKYIEEIEKEKLEYQEQLMKVEEDLAKIKDDLSKSEHQIKTIDEIITNLRQEIDHSQSRIAQLEKENQGLWNWLVNMICRRKQRIASEIELNRIRIMEYKKELDQEKEHLDSLVSNRRILKNKLHTHEMEYYSLQDKLKVLDSRHVGLEHKIGNLKQQLKRIKDQAEREMELKEAYIFHGELYEFMVNSNWSVLVDIQLAHQNLAIDCKIHSYLVQKIGGFYLPYEYHHKTKYLKSSYQRTIQSNRYHTIKNMTDAIQSRLSEDVKQLCSLIPK